MSTVNRIKIYLTISTFFVVLLGLLKPVQAWQTNFSFYENVVSVQQELNKSWAPQSSNIVALYHLNEKAGATTVTDYSGLSHTGTVMSGVTLGSVGKMNTAAAFNGSSGWIDFGNPTDLPAAKSARSMCTWFKPNSITAGYGWAFTYGSPSNDQSMFIGTQNGDIVAGGYGDDLRVSGKTAIGVWIHVCLTYDGTTGIVYINGALASSAAKNWSIVLSAMRIGRQVNTGAEYFNGTVDEVALWKSTLTAAEVLKIYSREATRY